MVKPLLPLLPSALETRDTLRPEMRFMTASSPTPPVVAIAIVGLIACSSHTSGSSAAVMFRETPDHTGISDAKFFSGQGGLRWQVQTDGAVRSSPAVSGDRIYVGSGDGGLYALDRQTGRRAWRFDAGGLVYGSPAVAGGLVVCANLEGRVFAVDRSSGKLRWSFTSASPLPFNTTPAGGWDNLASSPVVVGTTVVIGTPDGLIRAVELSSGKSLWEVKTGGRVRATPAVKDGMVVVGSFDGRVYALDLKTGAERWVHRTVGDTLDSSKFGYDRRAVQSSAAIAEGMVVVGSRDGALYGIDAVTGERRWRVTHQGSWVIGSPAVRDGRAYVGSSDGHFFQAVELTSGKELWRLQTEANVLSSPLLVGDALVVGTYRTDAAWGDLIALNPETGAVRWRLRMDGTVMSSPTAADGELYLGTDAGSVVAVSETSPLIPRMAVFYDARLAKDASVPGASLIAAYFADLGYQPLDADSLPAFLSARIADSVPSAVVFALDVVPLAVEPIAADTVLIRRYLNAGGKIVWMGSPLGSVYRDSTGALTSDAFARTEKLLGVPTKSVDYNEYSAHPTEAGRRWGLTHWFRGDYPIDTTAVSHALSVDESGQTTAWVQTYRPDRPGSGYVQLWGFGATVERLPFIRAAAEYGLLRVASP
jgi:eukaryotic-like serine/threonine-protein kinase